MAAIGVNCSLREADVVILAGERDNWCLHILNVIIADEKSPCCSQTKDDAINGCSMLVFACLPELSVCIQLLVSQMLLDGVVLHFLSWLHFRKQGRRGGKMDQGSEFGDERRRMKNKLGVWALLF